jgi:putative FmdB family regulatory protein
MPLYDFRCSDCASERDVRASFADADTLELVCIACGGEMRKVLSRTINIGLVLTSDASPSTGRPHLPKRDTCSDGAVKLSRPNPFRADLPAPTTSEDHTA